MLIKDPSLRSLFKTESEEHLQRLDELLLRLEKSPTEPTLIEEAFREAHSMKGAARMLGLKTILALTNRLENSLNLARQGTVVLGRDSVTQLLREVDAIRGHVADATGDAVEVAQEPRNAEPITGPPPITALPAAAETAVASAPTIAATAARIESVRVDTGKLDELMTHAGELVVARTRAAQRLNDLDEVIEVFSTLLRQCADARDGEQFAAGFNSLQQLRSAYAEDGARIDALSDSLENVVRRMRMLPLGNVLKPFPRMVRELGIEQDKQIELSITGEETLADKRILEEIKDPLVHLLRNAIDHGIETPDCRMAAGKPATGRLTIAASQAADQIVIEVSDDGTGLVPENIRAMARQRGLFTDHALAEMSLEQIQALILLPGFSTKRFVTDVSGRGVGMDVVKTNIDRLKGRLGIESVPGLGTRFTMRIPVALATMRVLLVDVGGFPYGLPTDNVGLTRTVAAAAVVTREGRNVVLYRGAPVPVARLVDLLGLPSPSVPSLPPDAGTPCVFLTVGKESFGVFVDGLTGEQHLLLKSKSPLLESVAVFMGAAILSSGEICTVLEPRELLARLPAGTANTPQVRKREQGLQAKKLILLAEDSITTRAQEIRILEGAGYEVIAATDGLDAYGKLGSRHFDAVVTDINMPRLDGLQLAERIRAIPEYADLPIILVTSLASDDDKRRGLEIGANAYITKPEFDQTILLDCLERLLG